jgi:mediator of RNA polymerase II transcription subunit 18, fungi type
MKPVTFLRRRLIWEGPRQRSGLKGIDPGLLQKMPQARQPLWKILHDQLVRQSYIITLVYEVDRDQFGRGEKAADENGEDGVKKDES